MLIHSTVGKRAKRTPDIIAGLLGGVWYDTLYDKKLNYAIQYIVMITIKVLTEKLSLHNLKTHLKKRNG